MDEHTLDTLLLIHQNGGSMRFINCPLAHHLIRKGFVKRDGFNSTGDRMITLTELGKSSLPKEDSELGYTWDGKRLLIQAGATLQPIHTNDGLHWEICPKENQTRLDQGDIGIYFWRTADGKDRRKARHAWINYRLFLIEFGEVSGYYDAPEKVKVEVRN